MLRTRVHGRRCDLGLGSAKLTSLAEARDKAHRYRKIARAGGDPLVERRHEKRDVPTFEAAAKEVHRLQSTSFSNAKHGKQWLASLRHVFTCFGGKRVNAVTAADVIAALGPKWHEVPETSRRVLQRISVIFDWCAAHGHGAGVNPTLGIKRVLGKHRASKAHHPALPFAQVPTFVAALRRSASDESVRLAFELILLCAARTSEVRLATWAEIDMDAKTWTRPARHMKARVPHRIPLATRCIEILERAKILSNGATHVFPGRANDKPLSNMAFLMALRRMDRADLTGHFTTHGFRSSFRDWAAECTNFPTAVCESALAHTLRDKSEAAYNRTDLFEKRLALMSAWATYVTQKTGTAET